MKKLPYKQEENKKTQITFKPNIKVITIFTIIVLLLTCSIIYITVYKKPSNILKRYLVKEEFSCKSNKCHKKIDDSTYTIYYKEGTVLISNIKYQLITNNDSINLQIKGTNTNCIYVNDTGVIGKNIDNKFTYSSNCSKYIDDANELLDIYNDLLVSSKVNLTKLKK